MPVVRQGDNYIIKDVPIFDEHVDHGRHTNLRNVDGAKLETILTKSLARLNTEYELPVAFDDRNKHTPKPGEEHVAPPVRGGYRNLKLGDFNGRRAIYADVRIPVSDYPSVEAFQRRSVEIFPDTLELDTLVLLGSKAPARDLGPLTPRAQYSRDGREVVRYEMESEGAPASVPESQEELGMNPDELKAIITATLQEVLPGLMKQSLDELINGDQQQPDADADSVPDEMDATPEGEGEPADEEPTGLAVQEREPDQYERLRAEDAQRAAEKYERRIQALEAKNRDAEVRADTEHYTRRLDALADKGIQIERADELKRIMGMKSKPEREAHLGVIEKNYRRDPTHESTVGREAVMYERQRASSDSSGMSPEIVNRIAAKAGELGNWDAAKAFVLNGKK